MSRYWSKFSQKKITAGKGPAPGNAGPKPMAIPESTAKWNISGSTARNLNKIGFQKVKHSVKTTL